MGAVIDNDEWVWFDDFEWFAEDFTLETNKLARRQRFILPPSIVDVGIFEFIAIYVGIRLDFFNDVLDGRQNGSKIGVYIGGIGIENLKCGIGFIRWTNHIGACKRAVLKISLGEEYSPVGFTRSARTKESCEGVQLE